jgi:NADPH:quinone reductase
MNRRWLLASRPAGLPSPENFRLASEPVPEPGPGQVLVRTLLLSVDPYVRGRLRNVRSYVPPLQVGDVIEGDVVGRVEKSRVADLPVGATVAGRLGWQDYAVAEPKTLRPADPQPAGLSAHLGVLGMTGLTAYFGLLEVGRVKSGETVLVSGAAGAVGSVVGQIARIKGARAVGIAGSDAKCAFLKELGFDAAVNYKTSGNLRKSLKEACPSGVDVYFDNVGGEISDAAITLINRRARVVICGQISSLNRERAELGPRSTPLYLLINRARMEGFLVMDYADRAREGVAELSSWLREGRLRHRETVVDGLENAPKAFIGLFTGENVGKMLVKVASPAA